MADISGKDLAYRALASALGGPVDLATMVMRPFGYAVEKPVLGSEWIGQKMQDLGLVSSARNPNAEMLASMLVPGPGELAGAAKGGLLALGTLKSGAGRVLDALTASDKAAANSALMARATWAGSERPTINTSMFKGENTKGVPLNVAEAPTKVVEIDPRKLGASQMELDTAGVKAYIEGTGREGLSLPTVVKIGDEYIIADGTHRLAAQILAGRDKVPVRLAEVDKLPASRMATYKETIPPGAQAALEEYIAGTATTWNTLLRSATPLEKFGSKSQRLIGDLDSYLASGYQAKGETLWRATAHEQADELAKLKVGDLFIDKGFMSTSRSKDVVINRIAPEMEEFVDNVHLLQIKLPNGQVIRGKDVVGPTDHFAWQKEFLLGRGHQFKVIGKTEENGFPVTILELQLK